MTATAGNRKPVNRPSTARLVTRRVLPVVATSLALGGSVFLAGNAFAADATEVKVAAVDDSYTSSARPTFTFGANGSLVAGLSGADRMAAYLKFTAPATPAGKALQKAELRLTRDKNPLPAAVTLKKVAGLGWTEKALNAGNAPAAGTTLATATPAATATTVSFDVTSTVTAAGTYAFAVTATQKDAIARFASAEAGATGPQLVLTYKSTAVAVPTPSKPVTPPTAPTGPNTGCTVDAKLVPSCNVLWGAAAGGFSDTPRDEALRTWEAKSGRTASIYHTYHRGDEMFPTKDEIAMAREAGKPRILFTNWKVGYGAKWADVARGKQDARIDKLSAYIKANYTDTFFMAIHHEPENDVSTSATSGMTAKDYAAMYRHTVLRMRANGVTNVVFVMAYMNVEKWNNSSWWKDIYPGNDVVDWVGVDSYVNAQPGAYHYGDFNYLMNRTDDAKFPGWYNCALTTGKPIMVAEWGMYECKAKCSPTEKAKIYSTVVQQLKAMPAIKAMVYFDTASDQQGLDMRIDSTRESLTAFKKIAADPMFTVRVR